MDHRIMPLALTVFTMTSRSKSRYIRGLDSVNVLLVDQRRKHLVYSDQAVALARVSTWKQPRTVTSLPYRVSAC